ncbi:ABC transporter permease [Corynebacterium sp.]|uniref:ABC transporter permease n=1 Tax=Corynebacterium sp. TaxID=1720 RepID=UPI0026DB9E60|nr:ABC transporter permease [Corynebacterium sp.]MDO5077960.1 ABC transporter permease [Corynebacterium sp.]
MRTAVQLEWFKMRRLRLPLIMLSPLVAGFLLASVFFRGDNEKFWPDYMLDIGFSLALTFPIMVAVVASRVTDMENSGGGWLAAASLGATPGQLCRAKMIALAPLVIVATTLTMAALLALGAANGLGPLTNLGNWAMLWIGLCVVNLWLVAMHILLSARVENQVAGLGVGVLGSFIGAFSFLMPVDGLAVNLLPWSYYANATTAMFNEHATVVYTNVHWVPFVIFAVVGGAAFVLLTRAMNSKD